MEKPRKEWKTLRNIHRKTLENHGKTFENHRKTFWKAGKDGGRSRGDKSSGGVTLIHQATHPETPFSYRKRKLAKARVTAAGYASFRENSSQP